MQLISQKVGALSSPVSIIDREERTPWPKVNNFVFRLYYVQDDTDSIFVVLPDHPLVRIRCVCRDDSVLFGRELCRVVVLLKLHDLLLFELLVLLSLAQSHFHTSVVHNDCLVVVGAVVLHSLKQLLLRDLEDSLFGVNKRWFEVLVVLVWLCFANSRLLFKLR